MTQKKTNYSSGTTTARRPASGTASRQTPPAARRRKKKKRGVPPLVALLVLFAVFAGAVWALGNYLKQNPLRPASTQSGDPDDAGEEPVVPDPPEYTSDGILMTKLENGAKIYARDGVTWLVIDGYEMILCNKEYSLPADYGDGLTDECQRAFDEMAAAAADDKVYIWIGSGFRSYQTQADIHSNYIRQYGEAYTKSMSAEPGHSEHQTGLGMDIAGNSGYFLQQEFETTKEFDWLREHAAEYGFILRYQKDKTWATGYIYEPWHFRYVGKELAKILDASGLTVEEYVGLATEPDTPEAATPQDAEDISAGDTAVMIG